MAKKAGADLWKEIQESGPAGWLIVDEGDEIPEVTFLTGHNVVEPGDTDLHGKIWDKEWTKNEVKVRKKNGEVAVLSIGWNTGAFLRTFIGKWQEHGLTPDTLIGTKWYIKREDKYTYDIRYLGREDEAATPAASPTSSTNSEYNDILKTVKLLSNEPTVKEGLSESDFLTAVAIKASIPKSKVSEYISNMIADNHIKIENDKIVLN